jgi:hypothetical protein
MIFGRVGVLAFASKDRSPGIPVRRGCEKMELRERTLLNDFPQGLKATLILFGLRHE